MWKYRRRSNMSVVAADWRPSAGVRILVVESQLFVGRRGGQGLAVLGGEVRRKNVMRQRSRVRAVDAVFQEHDAGNLRVVARSEENEPAVVAQVLPVPRGKPPLVRDHLRGTRLPADV